MSAPYYLRILVLLIRINNLWIRIKKLRIRILLFKMSTFWLQYYELKIK